ncbi:MAG: hypothetical protein LBR88_08575 [Zoogloeaceae bacterium]|jgi:hypothetical protein|nr:hypothetical protein [Zoogloeaceae bacterium]
MSQKIAYFKNWIGNGPALFASGPFSDLVRVIPLYDLEKTDLSGYRALLFSSNLDQRYAVTQRDRLEAYLEAGGQMVCNGHIVRPFLRFLRLYEVAPYQNVETLRIHPAMPHPIFAGVDYEDLTFRRGVAGFYSRGSNPVPEGAEVLSTISPQRLPVDWLLNLPGGGRLLVHSGNDIWMHANDDNSASRITPQLMNWLQEAV